MSERSKQRNELSAYSEEDELQFGKDDQNNSTKEVPTYTLGQEVMAEMIGTFILVFIGLNSGITQSTIAGNSDVNIYNIQTQTALASGVGVFIAIWLTIDISGAHLNLAVTLMLAVHFKFPFKKILPYTVGQIFGAFAAAALTFALNLQGIHVIGDNKYTVPPAAGATAQFFATYPGPIYSFEDGKGGTIQQFADNYTNFYDQVLGTFLLATSILIITDDKNIINNSKYVPVIVSMSVSAIIIGFSMNCGGPLNPSRDLGPRLFSWPIYGNDVWTNFSGYFWIPIVACPVGAILAGFIYKLVRNDFVAEMYASMIYILYSLGGVAQGILTGSNDKGQIEQPFSASLGYLVGLILTIKLSGTFMNPVICIVFKLQKKIDLRKTFRYIAAQFLGFFIGSGFIMLEYLQALRGWSNHYPSVDSNERKLQTARIFFAYPVEKYENYWTFAFFQFAGSFIQTIIIIGLTDKFKPINHKKYVPFLFALAIFGIQAALYGGSKPVYNPSYELATQVIGSIYYGGLIWYDFSWIPLVMPFAGGLMALLVYYVFIQYKKPVTNEQMLEAIDDELLK